MQHEQSFEAQITQASGGWLRALAFGRKAAVTEGIFAEPLEPTRV